MPEGEALWSGSVTHRFSGDTLLFVGFSSTFNFGTMKTKELSLFFFLNLAARKKEDKRRNVFLFFHLFALCADWTLVALTAGFKFFFLWVGGAAREEEKPWKEKNLDEYELVCYFKFFNHRLSAFQLLPGYSSVFKLKSLLLIRAKCLMLWDHSEYHLSDTAQGIYSRFWFQVKVPLSSPCLPPQVLKPRAGRWNVLVILLFSSTFFFFFVNRRSWYASAVHPHCKYLYLKWNQCKIWAD